MGGKRTRGLESQYLWEIEGEALPVGVQNSPGLTGKTGVMGESRVSQVGWPRLWKVIITQYIRLTCQYSSDTGYKSRCKCNLWVSLVLMISLLIRMKFWVISVEIQR